MKAEKYILVNSEVKARAIIRITEAEADGSIKVVISNTGSKTEKQQSLDWLWDSEILKSGIGWGDETAVKIHARSKWLFARPILLRDDEVFTSIFDHFMAHYGDDKEKCLEFAEDYISTQKMTTSQAAEYMTNKQNFWINKGVNLTNPKLYGLNYETTI